MIFTNVPHKQDAHRTSLQVLLANKSHVLLSLLYLLLLLLHLMLLTLFLIALIQDRGNASRFKDNLRAVTFGLCGEFTAELVDINILRNMFIILRFKHHD